jgi:uncharacterized protein
VPLFDYDPDKSQANKVKHEIDFEQGQELWNDENAFEGEAKPKGEKRFYRTGSIGKSQWTAIFTYRQDRTRLVSVGRAMHHQEELGGERARHGG